MLSRAVYRVRIVLGVASILFGQIPASHSEAADPCQRIFGDWGWFIGGKVSFSQNAQAKWTPGSVGTPPASATWSCDPRSGTYTVKWQNGFVDTLRLSEDGVQLNGTRSTGVKVSGGEPPVQPGPCRLQAAPPKRPIRVRLRKMGQTGGTPWVQAGLASRPRSPWVLVVFPSVSVPKEASPKGLGVGSGQSVEGKPEHYAALTESFSIHGFSVRKGV